MFSAVKINFSMIIKFSVAAVFIAVLIKLPQSVADGVRRGLTVCGGTVIPSLFPFSVLCSFMTNSGLCEALGSCAEPFMRKVFKLPGSAAGAVLMGFFGGFPIGIRMTEELYKSKSISQNDAQRMCLFCISAGPAFLIGTVGASMLGSVSAGKVLFFSVFLAWLTVGVLLRVMATESKVEPVKSEKKSVLQSFSDSVASAGAAMLSVCTWIILFSCICEAVKNLPLSVQLPLTAFLEITNGIKSAAELRVSLPIISAMVGWCGLSVHCQVWSSLERCNVRPSYFFTSRVVCGALAAVFCKALLNFFPEAVTAVAQADGIIVRNFSVSAPVAAAMLMTSGVFIINTSEALKNLKKNP